MILFRPTGLSELELVASLGWAAWPPRLPEQPIFYPVLSLEYARGIARDWNAKDRVSGFVGFVTLFQVQDGVVERYPVQITGGRSHKELWVPACELDEFNAHIVGSVSVLETYPGASFMETIDPETNVPTALSKSYRSRPRSPAACTVRRATAQDIDASVAVLIASITNLCVKDHLNDPATLSRWLRNKTTENFEQWLADPESCVVIAELGSAVCGVARLHASGTIRLCYVLPGMQRCGVGRALIQHLENEARALGLAELNLTSTSSARAFYEQLGYASNGASKTAFGVLKEYPYAKPLPQIAVEQGSVLAAASASDRSQRRGDRRQDAG
jgi:N-acetylglutamate synthase-like GNAT family acetyltransferase